MSRNRSLDSFPTALPCVPSLERINRRSFTLANRTDRETFHELSSFYPPLFFEPTIPARILLISDYRRIFAAEYGGCCRGIAIGLTCWWLEVFGEYQFHSIRDVWEIRKVKSRISYYFFFFVCPEARAKGVDGVLCRDFLRLALDFFF